MAQRHYLGPLTKQLRGDPTEALKLEKMARAKIGYLFDGMMSKQTFRTGSWNLGDGRKIVAFVWDDILGRRAIARLTAEGGEPEVGYRFLLIDNGALELVGGLTNYYSDEESSPYPLTVYFGDRVQDYLDGPGTPISPSASTYIHGQVPHDDYTLYSSSVEQIAIDRSYPSYVYTFGYYRTIANTEVLAQLNSERSYSFQGTTPRVTLSSNYTGVMRLCVQALLGAGRSPGTGVHVKISGGYAFNYINDGVLPFTGEVQPFKDGIIYDDQYTVWWVRIGSSDIKYHKLRTRNTFARSMLLSSARDEETTHKLLILLFAGLTPDPDAETISQSMSGLLNVTGSSRLPAAYGWHYNRAAPWKASIVTWRDGTDATEDDYYREVTLGTLSFEFDNDGEPEASLSIPIQDQEFAHQNLFPLLAFRYNTWDAVLPLASPETLREGLTADYPLYCFYTEENELEVLRFHPFYEDIHDVSGEEQFPCGLESVASSASTYNETNTGWYYTNSEAMRPSRSYSATVQEWINEQRENGVTSDVGFTTAFIGCWDDGILDALDALCSDRLYPSDFNFKVDIHRSYRWQSYLSSTQFYEDATRLTVIPLGDAECVIMTGVSRDYSVGKDGVERWDTPALANYAAEYQYKTINYRCARNDPLTIEAPFSHLVKFKIDGGFSGLQNSLAIDEPGWDIYTGTVICVSSAGTDDQDVPLTFNPGFYGAGATFAYKGGGGRYNSHLSTTKITGGYTTLPGTLCWVGDA